MKDERTVAGFGYQWSKFDQRRRSPRELRETFEKYFELFPWAMLGAKTRGMDVGCGTGRWARFVAPRVGGLVCIDAAEDAVNVARQNLVSVENCRFLVGSVGELPLEDGSMDFGYMLGVLHYLPRPFESLADTVRKLRPGAPLLLYVYYALDNRPVWYRALWRLSDVGRRAISRLPRRLRYGVTQAIAATVYWPLARGARVAERLGFRVDRLPLSAYRSRSFYAMRTDAMDRLGSSLEKRFTREELMSMMARAGLEQVEVAPGPPYWCALGFRGSHS